MDRSKREYGTMCRTGGLTDHIAAMEKIHAPPLVTSHIKREQRLRLFGTPD